MVFKFIVYTKSNNDWYYKIINYTFKIANSTALILIAGKIATIITNICGSPSIKYPLRCTLFTIMCDHITFSF